MSTAEHYRELYTTMSDYLEILNPADVLTVYDDALASAPAREVWRWCRVLAVQCTHDFVAQLARTVGADAFQSRKRFDWDTKFVDELERWMRIRPHLAKFSLKFQ